MITNQLMLLSTQNSSYCQLDLGWEAAAAEMEVAEKKEEVGK